MKSLRSTQDASSNPLIPEITLLLRPAPARIAVHSTAEPRTFFRRHCGGDERAPVHPAPSLAAAFFFVGRPLTDRGDDAGLLAA